MRLVVRFLLFESSLAWALMLAGSVRAGLQIWPFLGKALAACLRAWLRTVAWRSWASTR